MRAHLALTAALAAAITAAPAQADTVSPTKIRFPQVAVGPSGRTVVAWERLSRGRFAVEARVGERPQRLSRIVRLARVGYSPRVAVGADGTVAVEWQQPGPGRDVRVLVAIARRGHGFGRTQTVERRKGNVAPVAVAVQPNGRVMALWQRSESRFSYALAARGHRFGRSRALVGAGGLATRGTIAVDPRDGTIVLPYSTLVSVAPPTNAQASVRTLSPSQPQFAAPVALTATGIRGESSGVAVSGPGGTGVAYTISGTSPGRLALVRRAADGTWLPMQLITAPPAVEGAFAVGLRATLPAGGAAVAAWSATREDGAGFTVLTRQTFASIAPPGGPFGSPAPLSPGGMRFTDPEVAAAGDEAFVATAAPHGPVLLATRAAGAASFAAPVALTANGDGDVVLAAGGSHVLAAYQQGDRLRLKIVR